MYIYIAVFHCCFIKTGPQSAGTKISLRYIQDIEDRYKIPSGRRRRPASAWYSVFILDILGISWIYVWYMFWVDWGPILMKQQMIIYTDMYIYIYIYMLCPRIGFLWHKKLQAVARCVYSRPEGPQCFQRVWGKAAAQAPAHIKLTRGIYVSFVAGRNHGRTILLNKYLLIY